MFHKNPMYCPSNPPECNNHEYYNNILKRIIFYNE